jgi:response regulator RpfG family c-di-GMP phosphodiesterase
MSEVSATRSGDVLVVDDHEPNLMLYAKVLGKIGGVTPRCFTEPKAALAWAETKLPVLAVLDQSMPQLSGLEFADRLRAIPGRESVPFLMVTANDERELRRDALRRGALGFLTKPVDPVEFLALATNVLTADRRRRDAVTRADEHGARVRDAEDQLSTRDAALLDALFAAMRVRDPKLAAHGERVAALTARLAKRLGVAPAERALLERAARVHDVGKIAFPDRITTARTRLSAADVALVREHAAHARAILGEPESALLRTALVVATGHHERWDGEGYPGGLRGEAIPLNARIVAVADAFCAMTGERPWRPAMSPGHALGTIEAARNTAYDPRVVAALREAVSEGS